MSNVKAVLIAKQIIAHKDGVHCWTCSGAKLKGNDDLCCVFSEKLDKDETGFVRCEECLVAELAYKNPRTAKESKCYECEQKALKACFCNWKDHYNDDCESGGLYFNEYEVWLYINRSDTVCFGCNKYGKGLRKTLKGHPIPCRQCNKEQKNGNESV